MTLQLCKEFRFGSTRLFLARKFRIIGTAAAVICVAASASVANSTARKCGTVHDSVLCKPSQNSTAATTRLRAAWRRRASANAPRPTPQKTRANTTSTSVQAICASVGARSGARMDEAVSEVVEAARFVQQNPGLKGEALDQALGTKPWDPSVLSLAAFQGVSVYEPEELVGKTLIAITNLPPRAMMGIDSCGMLLSAVHEEEGEEKLHLLMVDDHIPAGAKLY